MFIDKLLQLSDSQTFAATGVSTNTVDLLAANQPIGDGERVGVSIAVTGAAVGTGTYQFDLVSDDVANLSSPTVLQSRTILAADLTVGSKHFIGVPRATPIERFIGLRVTLGGTSPGITLSAWVAPQETFGRTWRAYPKNYVA